MSATAQIIIAVAQQVAKKENRQRLGAIIISVFLIVVILIGVIFWLIFSDHQLITSKWKDALIEIPMKCIVSLPEDYDEKDMQLIYMLAHNKPIVSSTEEAEEFIFNFFMEFLEYNKKGIPILRFYSRDEVFERVQLQLTDSAFILLGFIVLDNKWGIFTCTLLFSFNILCFLLRKKRKEEIK